MWWFWDCSFCDCHLECDKFLFILMVIFVFRRLLNIRKRLKSTFHATHWHNTSKPQILGNLRILRSRDKLRFLGAHYKSRSEAARLFILAEYIQLGEGRISHWFSWYTEIVKMCWWLLNMYVGFFFVCLFAFCWICLFFFYGDLVTVKFFTGSQLLEQ